MEDLKFKTYSQFKQFKEDIELGILYIEGYASKFQNNGKAVVDYDGEIVDVRGFDLSTCTTLLFNHDHDEYAVGKCRLEHRPDGAYLYGEIHKEMNDKVYYAVKHGIMTDFSIGFVAKNAEYQVVDGEDVLTFTEGFVFETSIVNVIGANPLAKIEATKSLKKDKKLREIATWLQSSSDFRLEESTELKSIKQEDGCIGFACSIKQLKQANPEGDCGCTKGNKENMSDKINEKQVEQKSSKDIIQIIKGLTFEETMQDSWNEKQRLNYYMEILAETISDNWYESMWSDSLTPEEAKQNILNALDTFKTKLDEFTTLQFEPTQVQKNKREIMEKSIDNTSEVVEETPTEEVTEILEGGDDTPAEPVEEPTTEQVAEKKEETTVDEVVSEEEVSDNVDAPVEQSVSKPTVQTIIGTLQTVSLDELSDEEIEAIYNTSADLVEKIEALVRAETVGE